MTKSKGVLYKRLRINCKRSRKGGALKDNRAIIKGRVDIDKRLKIVEIKDRIDYLEVDKVRGKDQ